MQRLKLPTRPDTALLSALILAAAHVQTLRTESTSPLSPAGEVVIPEIDMSYRRGVLNPIFILVMDLSAKIAIPLSSITIFGGAVGNFFLNLRRIRDNSTKPLIDCDVILVMQPLLLFTVGATCGTFLNTIIPALPLSTSASSTSASSTDRTTGIRTL
ncbi:unnamed protein product [Peronospora destructor]|uniref:Uncharacterized protein n=1 Tax=Peronospora destructor TaxID=86335 RepID=A0AAV0TDJ2_9STRA|nr:unnamed protein product [Peronospora destructor]